MTGFLPGMVSVSAQGQQGYHPRTEHSVETAALIEQFISHSYNNIVQCKGVAIIRNEENAPHDQLSTLLILYGITNVFVLNQLLALANIFYTAHVN